MTATILVVDDEPDLETLIMRKFRKKFATDASVFVFARDGVDALQAIEQHPHVDLVVMDINMPRMDGLSLLAKLRREEDKKSAIIVSAYGDMSNIRTAMNRGAFDFLTKPIDFADLEATILKDHPSCRGLARGTPPARRSGARAMRRCLSIFRPNLPGALPLAVITMTCRYAGATSL